MVPLEKDLLEVFYGVAVFLNAETCGLSESVCSERRFLCQLVFTKTVFCQNVGGTMKPQGTPYSSVESRKHLYKNHYNDVIMTTIASQITSLMVVYSTVYSDPDQRKHQSSASLAFVWGIHRDRWIPRTKGQLRGKCFHLMTSSCVSGWVTVTDNRWKSTNPCS